MNNITNIDKEEIFNDMINTLGPEETLVRLFGVLTPLEARYYWTKIKASLQSEKDASKIHLL